MDVTDRPVVVTGATGGIGRATAELLAGEGARVALLARTESDLRALAGTLRDAGGTARAFPTDLADREAVAATADDVRSELGDPEVLVNSAGVGAWEAVWESDPGDVERITGATALGAFNLAREFLPAMLARDRGHVAVVESPAAHAPIPGATAYAVARYALRGLAESLWVDLHSTGVEVTSVVPGRVETGYAERNANVDERLPDAAAGLRVLQPGEVAEALLTGLRERRRRVVLPRGLRWALRARRLFPDRVDARTARGGWQPGDGRGDERGDDGSEVGREK